MEDDEYSNEAYINNPEFPFKNLNFGKIEHMRKSLEKEGRKSLNSLHSKKSFSKSILKQGNSHKLQKGTSRGENRLKNFITRNIESINSLTKKKDQFVKSKKACNRSHIVGYDSQQGNESKKPIKEKGNDAHKNTKVNSSRHDITKNCASEPKKHIGKEKETQNGHESREKPVKHSKLRSGSETASKNLLNDKRNKSQDPSFKYGRLQSMKSKSKDTPTAPNKSNASALNSYKSFAKEHVGDKSALTKMTVLGNRQNIKGATNRFGAGKKEYGKGTTLKGTFENKKATGTRDNENALEEKQITVNEMIDISSDEKKNTEQIEMNEKNELTAAEEREKAENMSVDDTNQLSTSHRETEEDFSKGDVHVDNICIDSRKESEQTMVITRHEDQKENFYRKHFVPENEEVEETCEMKSVLLNEKGEQLGIDSEKENSFLNHREKLSKITGDGKDDKQEETYAENVTDMEENKKRIIEGLKSFNSLKSLNSLNTVKSTISLKSLDLVNNGSFSMNTQGRSFLMTENKDNTLSQKSTKYNSLQYNEYTSGKGTEESAVENRKRKDYSVPNNVDIFNKTISSDKVRFHPTPKDYKCQTEDHVSSQDFINKEKIKSLEQISFDRISQISGSQFFQYGSDENKKKTNSKGEAVSVGSVSASGRKSIDIKSDKSIKGDDSVVSDVSSRMEPRLQNVMRKNYDDIIFSQSRMKPMPNAEAMNKEHHHLQQETYFKKDKYDNTNAKFSDVYIDLGKMVPRKNGVTEWTATNIDEFQNKHDENEISFGEGEGEGDQKQEQRSKEENDEGFNKGQEDKEAVNIRGEVEDELKIKEHLQNIPAAPYLSNLTTDDENVYDFTDMSQKKDRLLDSCRVNKNIKDGIFPQESNRDKNESCAREMNEYGEPMMVSSRQENELERGIERDEERAVGLISSVDTYNTEVVNMYKKKLSNNSFQGEPTEKIINKKLIMKELFGSNYEPSLINMGDSAGKSEKEQMQECYDVGVISKGADEEGNEVTGLNRKEDVDDEKEIHAIEIKKEQDKENEEEESEQKREQIAKRGEYLNLTDEELKTMQQNEEKIEKEYVDGYEGEDEDEPAEEDLQEDVQEVVQEVANVKYKERDTGVYPKPTEHWQEVQQFTEEKHSTREKCPEKKYEYEKNISTDAEEQKEEGGEYEEGETSENVEKEKEENEKMEKQKKNEKDKEEGKGIDTNLSDSYDTNRKNDFVSNEKAVETENRESTNALLGEVGKENVGEIAQSDAQKARYSNIDNNLEESKDDDSLLKKYEEDSSPLILSKPVFDDMLSESELFKSLQKSSKNAEVSYLPNNDYICNQQNVNGIVYTTPGKKELLFSKLPKERHECYEKDYNMRCDVISQLSDEQFEHFLANHDKRASASSANNFNKDFKIHNTEEEIKEKGVKEVKKIEREKKNEWIKEGWEKTPPKISLANAINLVKDKFKLVEKPEEITNNAYSNRMSATEPEKHKETIGKFISRDHTYNMYENGFPNLYSGKEKDRRGTKKKSTSIYSEHVRGVYDLDESFRNDADNGNDLSKLKDTNFRIYKDKELDKQNDEPMKALAEVDRTKSIKGMEESRRTKTNWNRETLDEYNKQFNNFNQTFDTYNRKFDRYNQKFEKFSKEFGMDTNGLPNRQQHDQIEEMPFVSSLLQSQNDFSYINKIVQNHVNKCSEKIEEIEKGDERRINDKENKLYLKDAEHSRRHSYKDREQHTHEISVRKSRGHVESNELYESNDGKEPKELGESYRRGGSKVLNEQNVVNEYFVDTRKRKNIFENAIIDTRSSINDSNHHSNVESSGADFLDQVNKKAKRKEDVDHCNVSYDNSECSKGMLFQSINETTNSSNTVTSKRRNYISKESNTSSTFNEIPNFFNLLNSASIVLGAQVIYVTDETHGKCENILNDKPLLHTTLEMGFYEHMGCGVSNCINGNTCNENASNGITNRSARKDGMMKAGSNPLVSSDMMLSANSCSRHSYASSKNIAEVATAECGGWLTKRRIKKYFDFCVVKLSGPTLIKGIDVDTYNFLGNYAPYVSIEGAYIEDDLLMENSTFMKYVNKVKAECAKRKEYIFEKKRNNRRQKEEGMSENKALLKRKSKETVPEKRSSTNYNSTNTEEEEIHINGTIYYKRNKYFYQAVLVENGKVSNEEYESYVQSLRTSNQLVSLKNSNKLCSYVKNGNEYRLINGKLYTLVDVTKEIIEAYPELKWEKKHAPRFSRHMERERNGVFRNDMNSERNKEKEKRPSIQHVMSPLLEKCDKEGGTGGEDRFSYNGDKECGYTEEEEEDFFSFESNEYNPNTLFLDNDYSVEKKVYNDLHKHYQWVSILEDEQMNPGYEKFHHNCFNINTCNKIFTHLIICLLPDGGIHRLRVYGEIKKNEKDREKLWNKTFNMCNILDGSSVVFTTDEFYGRSENILFDQSSTNNNNSIGSVNGSINNTYIMGWQTSRTICRPLRYVENLALQNITTVFSNHHFCIIKLSHISKVKYIEINTIFYEYNFPLCVSVESCYLKNIHGEEKLKQTKFFANNLKNIEWNKLIPLSYIKGNHINYFSVEKEAENKVGDDSTTVELISSHLRLNIFPDGGINTFKAFGVIV